MAQNPRTMELLDTVDALLRALQRPVHYKDLCKVLVDSGAWAEPWGKEPDQILFSAIHNDVKRSGQGAGRFLFMGGGVFCTSFVEGVEHLAEALPSIADNAQPRDQYARPGDMPGEADARRRAAEAADSNRRCGNCMHLSWEGPNAHTHEAGSCSMYQQTRRATVFKCSEACQSWKRRTASQSNADRLLRAQLIVAGETIRLDKRR